MSSYVDKPLSLVERKKQQWAKEREELSGLYAPWANKDTHIYEKSITRSRYTSKNEYRKDGTGAVNRRSSLPPLVQSHKNQNTIYVPNDKLEKEMGGETSGYGSDNPNHTPEYFQQAPWTHTLGGYESSSSYRDDRPKWGDRGVGVAKFWNPKEITEYNKNMTNDTPGWVKRGLQREGELIVANSSPAESPEQDFREERPFTSSSNYHNRSYIRGQNIPLEPSELAERERRRQVALAHQEAIRQQLEEREQKRKEEKERRIKEEKEEELRIEREQEIERQRKEREQQNIREKIERERKRKEALQEALEIAEKEAKKEKSKQKMSRQNINENIKEKNKINNLDEEPKQILNNFTTIEITNELEPKQNNIEQNNKLVMPPKEDVSNNNHVQQETMNNNVTEKIDNNVLNNNNSLPTVFSPRSDNLALVLQTPIETLQGMQFAVLMPPLGATPNNALPIAIPVTVNTNHERTENRILTPTQYRSKKLCDSSTQTDYVDQNGNDTDQKYLREKFSQLEMNYDNRSRKERRLRTDERMRDNVEERPKWGANRPPTRYLKQSEKDPLYQRRKLRQKMRQVKTYDDKNNRYSPHSSDDSQTASPRMYRRKGYSENRRGRAMWRKNEQLFARNFSVYQTEIVPLESDKDQIHYKQLCTHKCCCHCQNEKHVYYPDQFKVVDIMKIEHNSPRESLHYKSEMIQNTEYLPECNRNSSIDSTSDVIQKLSTLHNGLMMKQEQWEKSPRTPSLSSTNRQEYSQ